MFIQSSLSPECYRNAIKASLRNFSNPFCDHFTGFFIGKWFYLSHHGEREFGSRITPHCAAVGYMKETEKGSDIHFLSFRGLFCPSRFLVHLLICIGICLMHPGFKPYPVVDILIGIFIALGCATFYTLMEITIQRSKDCYDALMELMDDPIAPFRDE